MKKSCYSLLALLAAGNGISAIAQQKDSTLVREMTIEKEYTPIVREADKITRMPEVETPQTNKTKIEYAEPTLDTRAKREVETLEVGAVNTAYPFSSKKGYFNLEGGNYMSLNGDLGYRFVDTEKDLFGFEMNYDSSRGKVKFDNPDLGKSKRSVKDVFLNLYYHHTFENLMLKTNMEYDYMGFNYYGRSDLDFMLSAGEYEGEKTDLVFLPSQKQKMNRFAINFMLHTLHKQDWDYKLGFGFNTFNQDYMKLSENKIGLTLGLAKNTDSQWAFGTDMDVQMLIYGEGKSSEADWIASDAFKNKGIISLKPAMKYKNGSQLTAQLGIRADFAFGVGPYVGIAPDFNFNWQMAEHWQMYGTLGGGINQYSLSDLTHIHRYYLSLTENRNSYKVADMKFGIRSNAIAGLEFDIYGNLGYTLDELFLRSNIAGMLYGNDVSYFTQLSGYTADAFSWKIGAQLKYQFSNIFGMKLKLDRNGWNVKDNEIASYKPGWEMQLGATLRPIKSLLFDLTYDFTGDRTAWVEESTVMSTSMNIYSNQRLSQMKMDNISQLNLKTNYTINEMFGLHLALNNLLGRQEIFYGMPQLGFHFLVGGSIRF